MLPEQITQIKKQLIEQISSTFPEDKKQSAISQIESMDEKQLEEFLKQNNLVKDSSSQSQQCIFCSIVSGQAQSHKIDENSDAIAILEINPISKGHSLVIPKKHSEKVSKKTIQLAEKIKKKINTKFKPKKVELIESNLFGHQIINILPIYTDETINSEKHQAKPEELEKLKKQLEKKIKPEVIKESKPEKLKEKFWLPQRIP